MGRWDNKTIDRERRKLQAGLHCHTHYGASDLCHGGPTSYVNSSGAVLEFQSMITGQIIKFDAFITEYTDAFEPKFETQEVYGRMDPIAIYKNTTRKINIAWTVVGVNHGELVGNWHKVQNFIQMLYPAYKKHSENSGALALSNPPLLKLKFMNWAIDSNNGAVHYIRKKSFGKGLKGRVWYENIGVAGEGLLVVPGSITVNTNLNDAGAVLSGRGSPYYKGGKENYAIFPREISLSSDFTVLHQHDLGHQSNSAKRPKKAKKIAAAVKRSKKQTTKKKQKTAIKRILKPGGASPVEDFAEFPYAMEDVRKK